MHAFKVLHSRIFSTDKANRSVFILPYTGTLKKRSLFLNAYDPHVSCEIFKAEQISCCLSSVEMKFSTIVREAIGIGPNRNINDGSVASSSELRDMISLS